MAWYLSESLWWLGWGYATNFGLMLVYLLGLDNKRQDELASRIGWGLDKSYYRGGDQTGPALQAAIVSILWFLVVMDIKKIWPLNEEKAA